MDRGAIGSQASASLIGGMLSVLLFPLVGVRRTCRNGAHHAGRCSSRRVLVGRVLSLAQPAGGRHSKTAIRQPVSVHELCTVPGS